jgi:nucleotide-binding universal stress UspA family protein
VHIKTILVPTDFSKNAQAAFEMACHLAQQLEAKIYLLHVQEESTLRVALKEGLLESHATDEEIRAAVEKLLAGQLASAMSNIKAAGVKLESLSRRGEAEIEIVKYANEIGADMIVMGKRGVTAWSAVAKIVLGSVAENVLKNSPCPTLIVKLPEEAE